MVAPLSVCQTLYSMSPETLGYKHLFLAHDVVKGENQEGYHALFHTMHNVNEGSLKILDNSVIETNTPCSFDTMKEAALIVNADVVVMPDHQFNARATVTSVMDSWFQYRDFFTIGDTELMVVPQGKTFKEFAWCAEQLNELDAAWWSAPRNLVKSLGTRHKAIKLLKALAPERKIHLMGFSDNMVDDLLCAQDIGVESIDSAVPFRTPKFGLTEFVPARGDWWDRPILMNNVDETLIKVRTLFS